jgi:hypothetical protein
MKTGKVHSSESGILDLLPRMIKIQNDGSILDLKQSIQEVVLKKAA